MKIYPNLAGGLRFYFGLSRALTLVFAAFWFVTLTFGPLIQKLFTDEPKLLVSVGEVSVQAPGWPLSARPVRLESDTAKTGSLAMEGLRGSFQADLLSNDPALASALRWTVFPAMAVVVGFAWQLFSSLRAICANLERKEVFSETNLRLVRKIGLILIGYGVAAVVLQLFAALMMDAYLRQHVTPAGLQLAPGGGTLHFSLFPSGIYPAELGILLGCVVLLLTEAFKQGLALKTENDLTV